MKILPVDFNEMEHCNFAGLKVDFLQLNRKELWNNLSEQVGQDLNYTGLDVNGYMEGQLAYDGTPVAYAVGKPTITITTAEDGTQTESINYETCNGYNSEYYGGYDFATGITSGMSQVISDILKIPSTYNDLPVTKILDSAFMGTVVIPGSQSTDQRQGEYIKDVVFGKNIKEIGMSAFAGLRRFGLLGGDNIKTTFNIPEGVEKIGSAMFNRSADLNDSFREIILPTTITEFKGNFVVNSTLKTIVYKCENATSTSNSYLTNEYNSVKQSNYNVVFEKTVKQLNGTPFYNTIANGLIFKHTDEDEITINIGSPKSAKSTNIFTDNTYITNYDWAGKNINATIYPLYMADWETLSTPTVTINGTVITIAPVENATEYIVYSGTTELFRTTETTIDLAQYQTASSQSIYVQAIGREGYLPSNKSTSVTLSTKRLPTPQISISDTILTITPVENATEYLIYMSTTGINSDFDYLFTTTETTVNLAEYRPKDKYTIHYFNVAASDGNVNFVNSYTSEFVTIHYE